MSLTKAQSALIKAFVDGAFFPAANVEQPNVLFNPPSNAAWARLHFVPAQPTVATLGGGGTDRVDGFLQIDLNYPLNKGTKPSDDMFEALRLLFTAGARFTYSGQQVVVVSCGRSQGRTDNGFWKVPVTVVFYAHITRS